MNRRDRRAQRAQGLIAGGRPDVTLPPGYAGACEDMTRILRAWLAAHPDCKPAFRLGPSGVMIVAPLDEHRARFCMNADAVTCGELLDQVARRRSGDGCTVFMLGVVLQCAGVAFERVSLDELGLEAVGVMSPGGDA